MKVDAVAVKYGVPTPETCKKLKKSKWRSKTIFYWVCIDGIYKLSADVFNGSHPCEHEYHELNVFYDDAVMQIQTYRRDHADTNKYDQYLIYPAPQIHEILDKMPKNSNVFEQIKGNHYAEELANVYLQKYNA